MKAEDLLAIIKTPTNKKERLFLLGNIPGEYDPDSGRPPVVIDGEAVSTKVYSHLSSYTPSSSDRVLLARVGKSYVILGNIV